MLKSFPFDLAPLTDIDNICLYLRPLNEAVILVKWDLSLGYVSRTLNDGKIASVLFVYEN